MIHSGNLLKCGAQQASPVSHDICIMSILMQHIVKHAVVAGLFALLLVVVRITEN